MLAPCEGKLTVNQNKPTQPSPLPLSLPLLLLLLFWLCLFVINKMIHLSAQTHPSRPLVTAFASLTQFSTEVNTSAADKRKCKNRHFMCYFYSLSALFMQECQSRAKLTESRLCSTVFEKHPVKTTGNFHKPRCEFE